MTDTIVYPDVNREMNQCPSLTFHKWFEGWFVQNVEPRNRQLLADRMAIATLTRKNISLRTRLKDLNGS